MQDLMYSGVPLTMLGALVRTRSRGNKEGEDGQLDSLGWPELGLQSF